MSEAPTNFQDPDNWDAYIDNLLEDDEAFRKEEIRVDPGQEPIRIDKYLHNKLERISRNKIQVAVKAGSVFLNGKSIKPNVKVKPLDIIEIIFPKEAEFQLIPEAIPLDVVYEDGEVVIINKPAGMVVHPGTGNWTGTLVNALAHHFGKLPQTSNSEVPRPGLVHRLDKDTSGILVVGKTDYALQVLAKHFFERTIDRYYEALVWGRVDANSGTIVGHIGRHKRNRIKQDIYIDGSEGKPAITHYEVIERIGYVTHIRCKLETGRTHQIRVHLAHLGHPVFGDTLYGGNVIVKGTVYSQYKQFVEYCFNLMPHQCLHAKSLAFTHPTRNEVLRFDSELPEAFQELLQAWRVYAENSLKS